MSYKHKNIYLTVKKKKKDLTSKKGYGGKN